MNPFYFGIPTWLICAICSYGFRERAIGQMSAEQIGVATLAHRGDRLKLALFGGVSMAVFFVLRFGLPEQQNIWFLMLLGVGAVAATYFEYRACKLAISLLPQRPARTLITGRALGLFGFLALAGSMAATVL